ncbi:MAG: YdiU family protein [Candidatus Nitronauta litoralis]|uniref:Protein nucleotidyltransferase YdiU n=1 Tax=Candidatus Nitronauta litoralis TaxID=2705533 RepID=A0A7T0BYZ0_9BACT|nr:MAG: YdiU family protein [Candidatus Nitronauta litoralis]
MNAFNELNFKNRFVQLGEDYFQAKPPVPVNSPYLVSFNREAAALIDLDLSKIEKSKLAEYFSGNLALSGATPLAMAYSGHQFGSYNPQLGDGRGLLLGEVQNERGEFWDIYLKGSGQTRFCRGFDGRATFRSSIREYLCQEAMHGLGIRTTRSLALVSTGELIYRQHPEPAGIVTRLARTHIRFGSFEYFFKTNRPEHVTRLADHVIEHYFPDIARENDRYRLMYRKITENTAEMIAGWQSVGFGHGVMNTDNMTLLGETFDYGPFGFIDRFNPRYVCNASDTHGRYAFNQQPEIGRWNLFKLGETLQHLVPIEDLQEELNRFSIHFNKEFQRRMAAKLGLTIIDSDFEELMNNLFRLLAAHQPDYTNFFRRLAYHRSGGIEDLSAAFHQRPEDLETWLAQYERLLDREDIHPDEQKKRLTQTNPKFILRNYLAQRAIDAALMEQDYSEIERLLTLLKNPFCDPDREAFSENDPDQYSADTPDAQLGMQVSCSA